jgi:hypothetical protein
MLRDRANWLGVHEAMVSMSWYGNLTLNKTALTNWSIDGTPVASLKSVDSFTFRQEYFLIQRAMSLSAWIHSRVFGGGHNLPAYVPSTALQFFTRVVENVKNSTSSTSKSSTSKSSALGSLPPSVWLFIITAGLWTLVSFA